MTFEGQYLTYEEYINLNGDSGSSAIEETPFNILEYNARMQIDEITFGRLKELEEIPQEVKMCENQIITMLSNYEDYNQNSKNGTISSENIDGYSISYQGASKELSEAMRVQVKDIINAYLSNVLVDNIPVLYRGVK